MRGRDWNFRSMLQGRCLLIPDVHQDADFLDAIFAREDPKNFDYLLFLGDFLDGRNERTKRSHTLERMLRCLRDLREQYSEKRVLALMGNHDLAYYRNWEFLKRTAEWPSSAEILRYVDEQLSVVTAGKLIENSNEEDLDSRPWWGDADWNWLRPFVLINGYLVSHAGIHPEFWPQVPDPFEALECLGVQWNAGLQACRAGESPELLSAGAPRGGTQAVG